jgi:hypothetical protein
LRRIAFGAACAFLVAGLAAAIGRRTLSDGWTSIQRLTPSAAWIAIQRHASDAWIAIRRHTPFDEPTPPSHAAVRDATAARGTHKRAQPPAGGAKVKAAAKRSQADMGTAGSTP